MVENCCTSKLPSLIKKRVSKLNLEIKIVYKSKNELENAVRLSL